MNYILVIISTILLSVNFALSKKYQKNEGTSFTAGLKMNAISGLFTALIFFILSGFKLQFSLFSAILSFAMSLCGVIYTIIGFKILKSGNMALYSLFLMSGGMLLPYVFGIVFLNETLTVVRILGIIIILAAVILSNSSKEKINKSLLLYCVAIFILNGFVSIISKCHQINTTYNPVDSEVFVMYSGVAKLIFSSVVLCFCKSKEPKMSFKTKNTVWIILASALFSGISYLFQLIGAKDLPATVLYPTITGGSIIFSAFAGKIFFKEKISLPQKLSVIICFVGTLLFL